MRNTTAAASRWLRDSSSFRPENSTSSMIPGVRPKMARYSSQMPAPREQPRRSAVSSARAAAPRRRTAPRRAPAVQHQRKQRQPPGRAQRVRRDHDQQAGEQHRRSRPPIGRCRRRGQCRRSRMPRARRYACNASASRQAARCASPRPGASSRAGQAQAVERAGALGREHPAGEARQALLQAERRRQVPQVEPQFRDRVAGELLGQHVVAARVLRVASRHGFPGDVARRIGGLVGTQAGEIVAALRVGARAARLRARRDRRQRARLRAADRRDSGCRARRSSRRGTGRAESASPASRGRAAASRGAAPAPRAPPRPSYEARRRRCSCAPEADGAPGSRAGRSRRHSTVRGGSCALSPANTGSQRPGAHRQLRQVARGLHHARDSHARQQEGEREAERQRVVDRTHQQDRQRAAEEQPEPARHDVDAPVAEHDRAALRRCIAVEPAHQLRIRAQGKAHGRRQLVAPSYFQRPRQAACTASGYSGRPRLPL